MHITRIETAHSEFLLRFTEEELFTLRTLIHRIQWMQPEGNPWLSQDEQRLLFQLNNPGKGPRYPAPCEEDR
jgi:hypothetical protein